MYKIINDTLKNSDGKWSRKSLSAFICFTTGILCAVHIVASDFYMPENVDLNVYVFPVCLTLFGTGATTLGLTVRDKINNS